MICVAGIYPSRDGGGAAHDILGEVMPFAGNFVPRDYLPADGRLLSIAQNTALFSLLGNTYGGNGTTTFALPDLRGRTIIGASTFDPLGEPSDCQPSVCRTLRCRMASPACSRSRTANLRWP